MDPFERFSDEVKKDINKFVNQKLAEDMERTIFQGNTVQDTLYNSRNESDCPECDIGSMEYQKTARGYKKYKCNNCDAVELRD